MSRDAFLPIARHDLAGDPPNKKQLQKLAVIVSHLLLLVGEYMEPEVASAICVMECGQQILTGLSVLHIAAAGDHYAQLTDADVPTEVWIADIAGARKKSAELNEKSCPLPVVDLLLSQIEYAIRALPSPERSKKGAKLAVQCIAGVGSSLLQMKMTDSLSEAFSGVLKMGLKEVMAANVNRIFVPLQRFNQARGSCLAQPLLLIQPLPPAPLAGRAPPNNENHQKHEK